MGANLTFIRFHLFTAVIAVAVLVWRQASYLLAGGYSLIDDRLFVTIEERIDQLGFLPALFASEGFSYGSSTRSNWLRQMSNHISAYFSQGEPQFLFFMLLVMTLFAVTLTFIGFLTVNLGNERESPILASVAFFLISVTFVLLPFWDYSNYRLWSAEPFLVFGFACFFCATVLERRTKDSRLLRGGWVTLVAFSLIISGLKVEGAALSLGLALLVLANWQNLSKAQKFLIAFSLMVGASGWTSLLLNYVLSGNDLYGARRTIAGLISTVIYSPYLSIFTFLVVVLTLCHYREKKLTWKLSPNREFLRDSLFRYSVVSYIFVVGVHIVYSDRIIASSGQGLDYLPERYGSVSQYVIYSVVVIFILRYLISSSLQKTRIISVAVVFSILASSVPLLWQKSENFSQSNIKRRVSQSEGINSLRSIVDQRPEAQILIYASRPIDYESVHAILTFSSWESDRTSNNFLLLGFSSREFADSRDGRNLLLAESLENSSNFGNEEWRISPLDKFNNRDDFVCVTFFTSRPVPESIGCQTEVVVGP